MSLTKLTFSLLLLCVLSCAKDPPPEDGEGEGEEGAVRSAAKLNNLNNMKTVCLADPHVPPTAPKVPIGSCIPEADTCPELFLKKVVSVYEHRTERCTYTFGSNVIDGGSGPAPEQTQPDSGTPPDGN